MFSFSKLQRFSVSQFWELKKIKNVLYLPFLVSVRKNKTIHTEFKKYDENKKGNSTQKRIKVNFVQPWLVRKYPHSTSRFVGNHYFSPNLGEKSKKQLTKVMTVKYILNNLFFHVVTINISWFMKWFQLITALFQNSSKLVVKIILTTWKAHLDVNTGWGMMKNY